MSNEQNKHTRFYSPSPATEGFLKHKPTLVADFGELFGVWLYECPHFGDERPLKAVVNCYDFHQRTFATPIWDASDRADTAVQVTDFLKALMKERPEFFA